MSDVFLSFRGLTIYLNQRRGEGGEKGKTDRIIKTFRQKTDDYCGKFRNFAYRQQADGMKPILFIIIAIMAPLAGRGGNIPTAADSVTVVGYVQGPGAEHLPAVGCIVSWAEPLDGRTAWWSDAEERPSTATDANGFFRMTVPRNAHLRFRMAGCEDRFMRAREYGDAAHPLIVPLSYSFERPEMYKVDFKADKFDAFIYEPQAMQADGKVWVRVAYRYKEGWIHSAARDLLFSPDWKTYEELKMVVHAHDIITLSYSKGVQKIGRNRIEASVRDAARRLLECRNR